MLHNMYLVAGDAKKAVYWRAGKTQNSVKNLYSANKLCSHCVLCFKRSIRNTDLSILLHDKFLIIIVSININKIREGIFVN